MWEKREHGVRDIFQLPMTLSYPWPFLQGSNTSRISVGVQACEVNTSIITGKQGANGGLAYHPPSTRRDTLASRHVRQARQQAPRRPSLT